MQYRLLGICAAAFGAFMPLAAAQSECDRASIEAFADDYVAAHETGSLSNLENIAENFTYLENNKTQEITSGIFTKALKIAHRHTIVDTVDCASFSELIVTQNAAGQPAPYVIGTQIRHNPEDLSVYLIDLTVSTTGSWLFNSTRTLEYVTKESWALIDEDKRDTREALRLAADAYLDMWHNKSAIDAVPWGTPCVRLEGSVYTGSGLPTDSCKVGIPTNNNQAPNSHRRYVTDVTYGSISVLCIFEHLANAPDSHEFRMENGKFRYIHTITLANSGFFSAELPEPKPEPAPPARYRVRGDSSARLG
ncbi:hypothetical protein F4820DRAFT_466358 [Hypoxylon rubiginosum]|uniref:Uncharacterized protein n=1 Tax=Hypoxylon rubiginosum TaxID=110542 RepID=A0ACB9YK91_9PEZI|nr:hypothetical protein F4820DRAFT_466358 [Hypoxylon rubiginosum]